jgi:hypothetical protein
MITIVGRLRGRDEGRVSLFLAIALFGVLVIIGLVADGSGRLRAMQRADNIAAEAARVGGQAINGPQAVTGGAKVIDPGSAVAAARAYLDTAGVTGTVQVGADRTNMLVTVTITYNTLMLGFIGIDQVSVTGRATAYLVTG